MKSPIPFGVPYTSTRRASIRSARRHAGGGGVQYPFIIISGERWEAACAFDEIKHAPRGVQSIINFTCRLPACHRSEVQR